MDRVLGIDLGGGSLRAGVVTRDGEILALVSSAHRIDAEADPAEWWRALQGLLAGLDLRGVGGVGLSGFGRSQVLLDAAGQPVRPALCFSDMRATVEAAELSDAARGSWTPMSAWHPLARLAWVARHEPAAYRATRQVLQPKDWLARCLTGQAASDRIGNAWALDAKGRNRDLSPFRRARIDPALLPILLDPWERVGVVRGVPALEGVPVFCGALDTWCATLGAGVGEGDGYIIAGTTDAAGMLTDAPQRLEGRMTLPWGEGLFHTGGPSGAGGACVDWFAGLAGLHDGATVAEIAEAAAPGAGPLFLPDLEGARAPLWQAEARGAFIGLQTAHRAPELARAVLEGVAMADAAVLEGLSPTRMVLSGGGARSEHWCRLRAGVLGQPVWRPAATEPGVLGAGLVALIGGGVLADLDAARAIAREGEVAFEALPDAEQRYGVLKPLFRAARAALRPISHELVAFRAQL